MKKLLLTALAVCAFGAMSAQDFKALKGDVTTDFSLFSNGILGDKSPVGLNNGMLKGRYFFANDLALRASLSISNNKNVVKHKELTTTDSRSRTGLGLGIEKHFAGTERLSPYVGVDLGVAFSSNKYISDEAGMLITVKGPKLFGFNASLLFGADYYIVKRVYLGVEAGLQFSNWSEGKTTRTVGETTTTDETSRKSDTSLGTDLFAGFKLGYAF